MAPAGLEAILRWPSARARRWVEALVGWAERLGRLDAVIAVGSAVRPDVESRDVDLVLTYVCERPAFPRPPRDVELTFFRRDEVEPLLAMGHDLLGWAVRFGAVLYDREGAWASLAARWLERVPLPSAAEAEERAAKAARHLSLRLAAGDEAGAREALMRLLIQESRARLLRTGVYPTSRPELPTQLREVGEERLARALEAAAEGRLPSAAAVDAAGLRLPPAHWTPG